MNKILCFIPAKENSQGLKKKNLKKIFNKTLTAITLDLAKKSHLFYKIVLSSDSLKILKIGKKLNIDTHLRPKKLSLPTSRTEEALIYSLEKLVDKPDYILILQVTSPLRKLVTLKSFVKECISKSYDFCLSVSLMDKQISNKKKYFTPLNNLKQRRRQDRKPFLYENSLFYFVKYESFIKTKSIFSKKWNYIITDEYESIDIDDEKDLNVCKKLY
jgi:CMP-N-acetylneuraminic acid synthetase